MAEKKQKRPVEAISGLYGAIPHAVMDGVAFKGASYPAKALLFELMRQHCGKNNGHLQLSFSWLQGRGWKSRDVIQRARDEIIERGLLIQTRQGGLNIGASRYAVTWLSITNFVGLEIQGKDYHPGAWGFMDACLSPNKTRPPARLTVKAIPLAGTVHSRQPVQAMPVQYREQVRKRGYWVCSLYRQPVTMNVLPLPTCDLFECSPWREMGEGMGKVASYREVDRAVINSRRAAKLRVGGEKSGAFRS